MSLPATGSCRQQQITAAVRQQRSRIGMQVIYFPQSWEKKSCQFVRSTFAQLFMFLLCTDVFFRVIPNSNWSELQMRVRVISTFRDTLWGWGWGLWSSVSYMSYVVNYQCVKRKVITCGIEKYSKIPKNNGEKETNNNILN